MRRFRLIRQELIYGIILFLILASVIPSFGQNVEKLTHQTGSEAGILYVGGSGPGNYTKIQDAVNEAYAGDTIYVYDDSAPYFEQVVVNKSITLIGEDKNSTEINGSFLDTMVDTLSVVHDDVVIRSFCITYNQGYYYQAAVKITGNYTILSNCIIKRNDWIGIYVVDASFCRIEDCELYQNLVAIHLVGSRGNVLRNCVCHDNADGITLFSSSHDNQLIDCICSENYFDNMIIQQSSGNQINGCVCQNGYSGISLPYAPNTRMRNNSLIDNYANFGIGSSSLLDFYCDIDTSNTINGKPMYYLIEQHNLFFDGTAEIGFLGLIKCHNVTVKNQYFSNNFEGMLLAGTNDSVIENCSFRNNDGHGMFLLSCQNTTVERCLFSNSFWDGIYLFNSSQNSVLNCSFEMSLAAMNLDFSTQNTLSALTIDKCRIGISFDSSGNNILRDNAMLQCGLQVTGLTPADYRNDAASSNTVNARSLYYYTDEINRTVPSDAGQVLLINCTGCVVSQCNLSNASIGLELAFSSNNRVEENIIANNSVVGIDLDGSQNNNNIIRNNLLQCNNYGVDVDSSARNLFQENLLTENGLGVSFDACGENTMIGNIIQGGDYGIFLVSSWNNVFTGNTLRDATVFGIFLQSSNFNVFTSNAMGNCSIMMYGYDALEYRNDIDSTNTVNGKPVYYIYGQKGVLIPDDAGEVLLIDSKQCIIKGLRLDKGTVGVMLAYSSNTIIQGNIITNQSMIGIDLGSADNNKNLIQGNILQENGYGIDVENSKDTLLRKNRILRNGHGIYLGNTHTTIILRNTISRNNYGISATTANKSILLFNNIYQNYAYGVVAEACVVTARWNWWGALTGPGDEGNGDHLHCINKGVIVYQPWLRVPVFFSGALRFLFIDSYEKADLDTKMTTLGLSERERQKTHTEYFDLYGLRHLYKERITENVTMGLSHSFII